MDPRQPFDPARVPFFYGWVIAGVSTLGVLMSIPGQTMGVSVFTDHLLAAHGVSRLSLSNAYLIGTLASGLTLPRGGRWLDRWGARRTALAACLLLAAALCFLAQSDRLATFLGGQNGGAASLVALALGFFALRFGGQGMLTMVSRNMLGKWFDRKRGTVAGISGLFVSFGFAAAPLGLSEWIGVAGFRGAWLSMAAAVSLGMGAVAWVFFRDNPEECGLRMDGAAVADGAGESVDNPSATDLERGDAIRTLAFWAVTGALALQGTVVTGFTFHIVDIAASVGLSEREGVSLFLPMAVVSTSLGWIVGIASDRTQIRYLVMVMMAALCISTSLVTQFHHLLGRSLAIGCMGVSGGFFSTLATVALPRLFGRTHLGAISGVMMMTMVLSTALGPSVLALAKHWMGSYDAGFLLYASLCPVVFGVALASKNPRTRTAT